MERSEVGRLTAEMTERLRGLCSLQNQMVEAVRQGQDVLLFAANPDLVGLDDELDIMYRGYL